MNLFLLYVIKNILTSDVELMEVESEEMNMLDKDTAELSMATPNKCLKLIETAPENTNPSNNLITEKQITFMVEYYSRCVYLAKDLKFSSVSEIHEMLLFASQRIFSVQQIQNFIVNLTLLRFLQIQQQGSVCCDPIISNFKNLYKSMGFIDVLNFYKISYLFDGDHNVLMVGYSAYTVKCENYLCYLDKNNELNFLHVFLSREFINEWLQLYFKDSFAAEILQEFFNQNTCYLYLQHHVEGLYNYQSQVNDRVTKDYMFLAEKLPIATIKSVNFYASRISQDSTEQDYNTIFHKVTNATIHCEKNLSFNINVHPNLFKHLKHLKIANLYYHFPSINKKAEFNIPEQLLNDLESLTFEECGLYEQTIDLVKKCKNLKELRFLKCEIEYKVWLQINILVTERKIQYEDNPFYVDFKHYSTYMCSLTEKLPQNCKYLQLKFSLNELRKQQRLFANFDNFENIEYLDIHVESIQQCYFEKIFTLKQLKTVILSFGFDQQDYLIPKIFSTKFQTFKLVSSTRKVNLLDLTNLNDCQSLINLEIKFFHVNFARIHAFKNDYRILQRVQQLFFYLPAHLLKQLLPDKLDGKVNLTTLSLEGNESILEESMPLLRNDCLANTLENLSIRDCDVSPNFLEALSKFKNLKSIVINHPKISPSTYISKLQTCEAILHCKKICFECPYIIPDLKFMCFIKYVEELLFNTKISFVSCLESLNSECGFYNLFNNVKVLRIGYTWKVEVTVDELNGIQQMFPSLQHLYIYADNTKVLRQKIYENNLFYPFIID